MLPLLPKKKTVTFAPPTPTKPKPRPKPKPTIQQMQDFLYERGYMLPGRKTKRELEILCEYEAARPPRPLPDPAPPPPPDCQLSDAELDEILERHLALGWLNDLRL